MKGYQAPQKLEAFLKKKGLTMQDYECRLKEYRQRKGLSQRQLAQLVGTHRDVIGRLEKRQREPLLRTALGISRVLDAPLEEIFIFPQENPRGQ